MNYLTDEKAVLTAEQAAALGYTGDGNTLWLPGDAGYARLITAATVHWESLDGFHSKRFRGRDCVTRARAYRDAEWPHLSEGAYTTDDGVSRFAGIRYTTTA